MQFPSTQGLATMVQVLWPISKWSVRRCPQLSPPMPKGLVTLHFANVPLHKCQCVNTFFFFFYSSLAEYIPGAAQMTGLVISDEKNIERQIELVILVPTKRTLDIIIKTPTVSNNLMTDSLCLYWQHFFKKFVNLQMTLSKSNLVLPIALTFEAVQAYREEEVMNIIRNLYIEASSG